MLRAASSRRVAASTGRFASQPESASPLFRATARRSSLLSQLRESPFKRKYIEEEEEEEMKIKPAVRISDGNLVIKDRTILTGLPDNVITTSASEAGPVEEVLVGSWLVSGSSFGGWPVFTLLYSQLAMVMNDEFQASLLMLLLRYKMTGQDSSSNNVNKLFMETMVARLEQMMIKHGEELHQRIDQSQGKAKPRRNMEKNENSDQRQTITDDDDDATSSLSNPRRHSNHGDNDMKGMKLKIPPFHGKNDPDAYLEWEKNRPSRRATWKRNNSLSLRRHR